MQALLRNMWWENETSVECVGPGSLIPDTQLRISDPILPKPVSIQYHSIGAIGTTDMVSLDEYVILRFADTGSETRSSPSGIRDPGRTAAIVLAALPLMQFTPT